MYPTDYLQQKALYVFDARLFGNVWIYFFPKSLTPLFFTSL
jgi:hypothetical protein